MTTILESVDHVTGREPVIDAPLYRLSVEQYHQMLRAGILGEDEPVELLEGLLVQKMGRNPPHRRTVIHLQDLLKAILPPGWHLQLQEAIALPDGAPEPDLAVVRGTTDDYPDRDPDPSALGLVVEVSDTTLHVDRGMKWRDYARGSIVEYWIVNLNDRQVEVYTDPSLDDNQPVYQTVQYYQEGDDVPFRLAGTLTGSIAVNDILP